MLTVIHSKTTTPSNLAIMNVYLQLIHSFIIRVKKKVSVLVLAEVVELFHWGQGTATDCTD